MRWGRFDLEKNEPDPFSLSHHCTRKCAGGRFDLEKNEPDPFSLHEKMRCVRERGRSQLNRLN
jgi:hypothetical protein